MMSDAPVISTRTFTTVDHISPSADIESDMYSSFRGTVGDVCDILRLWGEESLANRITYFASQDDLDEEEVPVTDASACGFLRFLRDIQFDGNLQLTCSPEGWLCATWHFNDARSAVLWFLDAHRVMFAATGPDGEFVEEPDGEMDILYIRAKLVETGIFSWGLNIPSASFLTATVSLDIATGAQSKTMEDLVRKHSDYEIMNNIYRSIGWNSSETRIGLSKSMLSFRLFATRVGP